MPTLQPLARQDRVGWLTEEDTRAVGPAAAAASDVLRGVAFELNRHLGWTLRVPPQCMCACYDGDGAHYVPVRHGHSPPCPAGRPPLSACRAREAVFSSSSVLAVSSPAQPFCQALLVCTLRTANGNGFMLGQARSF